jgi:hypothetical protein
MSIAMETKSPVTFSPDLCTDDAVTNYWLRQVTFRLRREICWCWYERGILFDSNPANLPPIVDKATASLNMVRYREEKERFFQTDPTARYLTEQLESEFPLLDKHCKKGSFGWVMKELALDETASFVLSLGLAVAFDNAVGSVVAACLNDPSKTHPNLALAQKLWDHPEAVLRLADPSHPLFRYGLLKPIGHSLHHSVIDFEIPVAVPALVENQLLFPELFPLPQVLAPLIVENERDFILADTARLIAARLGSGTGDTLRVVPVRGPGGAPYREIVSGIARITKRDVAEFRGSPFLLEDSLYMNQLVTFCWLRGVDLFLGHETVAALTRDKQRPDAWCFFSQSVPITVFMGITQRGQLANIPDTLLLPIIDVRGLSYHERIAHWKETLGAKAEGLDGVISECSRRFRYEKETINNICEGLRGSHGPISPKDFVGACRAELELDIGELAQKVNPRFKDEELILPHKQCQQFEEIVKAMSSLTEVHYGWGTARAWNESGISVLFAGPPGTGKTMAAEILAIKLDLPMYRIDLSQVVNKYIGETEKNLKRLFDTADISDMILFFDEADSLFGRRTEVRDAHDRYANLEISYLLERMERFKGLAILATNRKKDLDEAFLRRLRYIIDFPLPGAEERKMIWRQVVPKTVDVSKIDFDFLAGQFPLTGGHIRSIIFNACLQSANVSNPCQRTLKGQLTMEQIIMAVKREYDKLNRSVSLEHFGPYTNIVKRMEHKDERY